jgi:hypothetical protein
MSKKIKILTLGFILIVSQAEKINAEKVDRSDLGFYSAGLLTAFSSLGSRAMRFMGSPNPRLKTAIAASNALFATTLFTASMKDLHTAPKYDKYQWQVGNATGSVLYGAATAAYATAIPMATATVGATSGLLTGALIGKGVGTGLRLARIIDIKRATTLVDAGSGYGYQTGIYAGLAAGSACSLVVFRELAKDVNTTRHY